MSGEGPRVGGATVRPPSHLRPLVTRFAGYRYEGLAPGTHLGLPSRSLTVVISLGEPTRTLRGPDPSQGPADFAALAGGLHTRPVVIGHDDSMHGIQLDLTPEGARSLLGMPAGELASTVVDLGPLFGRGVGELIGRLHETPSWPERFAVLGEALTRRAGRLAGPPAELDHAWRCLAGSEGTVRISDLARQVGWSRRHLGERFTAEYGLTPKEAARVMRFEHSKRLLRRPVRPPLASVAATCGYYDQAHLAREWNSFIGCPPSAWLAAEDLPFVQDDETLSPAG